MIDGRRWAHQAEFLIYAKGGVDVPLELPADAQLVAVALDDSLLFPRRSRPDSLVLTLAEKTGPHRVRVRWVYPLGKESLEQPRLAAPIFQGVAGLPDQAVVVVPAGLSAKAESSDSGLLRQYLARAKAYLKLSAHLGDRLRGGEEKEAELSNEIAVFHVHLSIPSE